MVIEDKKTASLAPQAVMDPRFYYFDDYTPHPGGLYVLDFLQETNADYQALTDLYDIGDAWMASQPGQHDRDIWVMRITNEDPVYGDIDNKPAFFLFATIHAREVVVPELAIRYIKYLTRGFDGAGGYGVDPDVTWLVNHNVVYVLVMQNPDGHWANELNTGNNRRKNMDWDDGCISPAYWGVDLNRNHSFFWGCCGGSSGYACDDTYRGPVPAGEPETQAFQNFFAQVMRDQNGPNGDNEIPAAAPDDTTGIFISLHSYTDLVIWPWGFSGFGDPPNHEQMRTIGRKFAYFNGYDPSGNIWYDVDGATDDWTYGKFGIPSYTFEVGPENGTCAGFFPPYDCIDGYAGRDFWAENLPAFLYAHKIAQTPYMTAYGPDSEDVTVSSSKASQVVVDLRAVIADHRYGIDPLRSIAAAEYFIDSPGEDGSGIPMAPVDGSWGDLIEEVTAVVDTSGLEQGRHYIMVHGQNDNGDWGPFTAVFLDINGVIEPVPDIKANGQDGVVLVTPQDIVEFTISLDPGTIEGELFDWWIVMVIPPNVFYPVYLGQIPLLNLPAVPLFSGQIPEGVYGYLFVLDDTPDGLFSVTWLDYVILISQTPGTERKQIPDFKDFIQSFSQPKPRD
jgi:hypothetical protein